MGFKVGTTTIHEHNHTLGLDIISEELKRAGYDVRSVTHRNAKECDVLLVSLYWVDQALLYPQWLSNAKINPVENKPIIIVGGSVTWNPIILQNMYNYAVIGDGENIVVELIKNIEKGNKNFTAPWLIKNGNERQKKTGNVCKELKAYHYVESRTNKITRIEIARGCKGKCKFCQLTWIKPYRELPPVVLKNLIATAPTNNIALFSPDRGSYSEYEAIERWCLKYKKRNIGTDIRLISTKKIDMASSVRIGIEGFSERERKSVNKPYKNLDLANDIAHIYNDLKTPKGKPITVITAYMLIGLPGQCEEDYQEFADTLRKIDVLCGKTKYKKTLFLTLNDFLPMNHTPMENATKDIFTDHLNLWMKHKPHLENITIAQHGGTRCSAVRLAQLLVSRGGENANTAIYNISTKYQKLLNNKTERGGQDMIIFLKKCGVDIDVLINGYQNKSPWENIRPINVKEDAL